MQGDRGTLLIGARGANGPQGAAGVQGSAGTVLIGTRGESGPQGAAGVQGSAGTVLIGARGESGPQGAAGIQGSRGTLLIGARGANGPQGEPGKQGSQGELGIIGSQGSRGENGSTGLQGAQGDAGAVGSQGSRGATGSQGAAGLQGDTGSMGLVGETGELVSLSAVNLLSSSHTGKTSSIYIIGKDRQTHGWNGNFYVSQAYFINNELYEGSDERYKEFVEDVPIDFDRLSTIPKKFFYWVNGDKKTMGTSAQKVAEIYPEIVNTDENGFMSVSYEKLSIVALAAIDKLNERIKELENIVR